MISGAGFKNLYKCVCVRDGVIVWEETRHNIVVNEGLDDVLTSYFKGASYNAQHFVGLKGVGAVAAADTLASHAGWTEETGYAGTRKQLVFGAVANQAVDNNANRAQFNISASATIAGIIVATVDSGNVGVLYGAVDFSLNRPVVDGDVLIVTCTFTQRSI